LVDILHVITSLGAGGAEAMVSKVALDLQRRGCRNRVLSLGGRGFWGPRLEQQGIPVVALNLGSRRPWATLKALASLQKPEVVQGWMYHGNLAAWALGRLWAKPFAWNIRATWDPSGFGKGVTLMVMQLNRLLSAQPKRILCNSHEAVRGHLAAGFRGAWEVIPNGFELERYRPNSEVRQVFRRSLGLADSDLLVGMAARFHPMKDHGCLLEAWAQVAKFHPNAHLLLAGTGVISGNDWFAQVLPALPGGERVHLLGERSDMETFQTSLDLAVLSSAYGEAFPNSLGEAMACGVPCVATDVGDSREIVGGAGLIVPPHRPDLLALAILEVLGMAPTSRRNLGLLGLERVRSNYTIQCVSSLYESFYRELTGSKVSPR
jgi:glycosyltransferase involved in cell wall biosynthesis